MTIDEYQRRLEALEVGLNRETYRQYAGLPYDEERMARLARDIEAVARRALEENPPESFPRPLLYATVRATRASDYARLDDEIYRARIEQVFVDVGGDRVHLGNLRLFNQRHLRNASRRREAFEGLLDRAPALTPLLAERFALSRELFAQIGLTPLEAYLEEEDVDLSRLTALIEATATSARETFQSALARFASEVMGKRAEFYDDYYVFTGAVFEPVDPYLGAVEFAEVIEDAFRRLGFVLSGVTVDDKIRAGKHASPICMAVQIPNEIFVLFQPTSPVADYIGYAHEMGHAVHFSSVDAALPYTDRCLVPAGILELFSTFMEGMATEPSFLREEVGLPEEAIADFRARGQFMELFFLTFYAANALFKIRFWTEQLDMAEADRIYAELYERHVGLAMPGGYWQLHHVLGVHDVYAPSYLLGRVRAGELRTEVADRFSERWWSVEGAGDYLRALMRRGRRIPLEGFSSLDPEPYLACF